MSGTLVKARAAAGIWGLLLCGSATALASEEPVASPPSEVPPSESAAPEITREEVPSAETPEVPAPSTEALPSDPPPTDALPSDPQPADALPGDAAPEPPVEPAEDEGLSPREPSAPVVSTLDFEAAAYMSLTFAELPVPDTGSLNPVGGGLYGTLRYVPATFPFHAYFHAGGGLFATGTTSGPSGTAYTNALSALFFSPGIGLDLGALRLTFGLGPAVVFTSHSAEQDASSSTSLAFSGDMGISYRFFEKTPWAMSGALRYQTVPGAKIDALSLGISVRFGSIAYR